MALAFHMGSARMPRCASTAHVRCTCCEIRTGAGEGVRRDWGGRMTGGTLHTRASHDGGLHRRATAMGDAGGRRSGASLAEWPRRRLARLAESQRVHPRVCSRHRSHATTSAFGHERVDGEAMSRWRRRRASRLHSLTQACAIPFRILRPHVLPLPRDAHNLAF